MHNQVSENQLQIEWRIIEATVTGASHVRGGLPNQDAIQSWQNALPQSHLGIAIADGHGSSKCYRSDRGAKIAVQVAVEAAQEFCSHFSEENLSKGSPLEQLLLRELLSRWKEHLNNSLKEMLSSTLMQAISETNSLQEVIAEYWGKSTQNEVFNSREWNQLGDLATRVIKDFLLHQSLSMKALLGGHLTRDLLADLNRALQDAAWFKAVADRVSQEIWLQFLARQYKQICDSYMNQRPVDDQAWRGLKDLTSSISLLIERMSSTFMGVLIKCLCQTWEDAFRGASAIELIGGAWLSRRIVEKWSEAVKQDIEKDAVQEEKFEEVRANPLLAYGSTLLAVVIAKDFILYLQLGDGDILAVSETGDVVRPIRRDMDLIANETYSLCMPEAWRLFRVAVKPLADPLPAMIMLSTDGYSNSYETEEDFFKVAEDILEIARTEGEAAIRKDLKTWLKEASELASGDDITLGAIFRQNVFKLTVETSAPSHDGGTQREMLGDPDEIQKADTVTTE